MKKFIFFLIGFYLLTTYLSGQPIIIRKFHFIRTDLLIGQGTQSNPESGAESNLLFIRSNNDYRYKNLNGNLLYEQVQSSIEDDAKVSIDLDQIELKARLIYYIFGYNYYYVGLSSQRHTAKGRTEESNGQERYSSTLEFTNTIPGFGAQVARALFGFYYGFGSQRYIVDANQLSNKRPVAQSYAGNLYYLEVDSGGRVFGNFFNRFQFLSTGFNGSAGSTATTFTNDRLIASLGLFLDKDNRIYFEYENRKMQSVVQRISVETYIHNSARLYYRFLQQYGVGLFFGNEEIVRRFTGNLVANAIVEEKQNPGVIGLFLQFFVNNF